MNKLARTLNFVAIIIFCVSMILGFWIEFFHGQQPCILCYLQRSMMMGIGLCLFFNLSFGVRLHHYGFALLWSLLGLSCALRHAAINICREVPMGAYTFGPYRLYTWSFLLFFCSILGISLLLCLERSSLKVVDKPKKDFMFVSSAVFLMVVLIVASVSAFISRGVHF